MLGLDSSRRTRVGAVVVWALAAAACLAPVAAWSPAARVVGRRQGATPLVVCNGVTKKNRRRITEKNTGGSVGENARRKREAEFPNRIFFANVRYDITEETLKPFFGAVGPVTHVKIVRDSFTGQSKGYGFATYSDALYATTALRSLNGQPVDGRVDHRGDRGGLSALSESVSKSACAFPIRSSAALVLASSASAFSARARSACSSRSRRSRGLLPSPDSEPAAAALRHSMMWEVYRPSRRRISPRPERSAASYSARIAALNSAVNVRLLGRSARGAIAPSSVPTSATVIVISVLVRSRPVQCEGQQCWCLTPS